MPVWRLSIINPSPHVDATLKSMATHPPMTIWMTSADTGGSGSVPGGQTEGVPCLSPDLVGPTEFIEHALRSLNRVIDPATGLGLVDLHAVKSLKIGNGEVVLTLTIGSHTGHDRKLADEAFHALCQALPDTDIYVQHEV